MSLFTFDYKTLFINLIIMSILAPVVFFLSPIIMPFALPSGIILLLTIPVFIFIKYLYYTFNLLYTSIR